MTRKTERLYASTNLQGDDWVTASHSIALALQNLANDALVKGREALFDTLEVQIERTQVDQRSFGEPTMIDGYATITVSAEAVRLPVSETTTTKDR